MISGFYIHGNSLLHRCGAGLKLLLLAVFCFSVFLIDHLLTLTLSIALIIALLVIAQIPVTAALRQLKPVVVILAIIFIVQLIIVDLHVAALIVLRFAVLILAASLVTLTTHSADMLSALETGLKPLSVLGINTNKISLALSLAIRFIPTIATATSEVREAQRARGIDTNLLAVAVPTVVRTLKMADDIADAIDARCYDSKNVRD